MVIEKGRYRMNLVFHMNGSVSVRFDPDARRRHRLLRFLQIEPLAAGNPLLIDELGKIFHAEIRMVETSRHTAAEINHPGDAILHISERVLL